MEPLDEYWMSRCLELANQGRGKTAPNPLVGSVVVKEGIPIGEGFHPQAGQPHAEVFALRSAGNSRGATLYVNLEPCNHHGRTPPCTEAIMAAGIERVVIGMIDPDPRVAGKGALRLSEAGIAVTLGILESACRQLNEAFIHRVHHQMPFGILKYAMTLDGKIATSTGHSYWITSPEARAEVHRLRSACDAIVTGGNTVRQDNPHLTTHGLTDGGPLRVVMSRRLDLPLEAHLWNTATIPTIVATLPQSPPENKERLARHGVEIWQHENLSPRSVMAALGQRGCNQVLWECGGTLAASAIQADMVQKIYAFIAPKIIGGIHAPGPIGELHLKQMTDARSITAMELRPIGRDFLMTGYLEP